MCKCATETQNNTTNLKSETAMATTTDDTQKNNDLESGLSKPPSADTQMKNDLESGGGGGAQKKLKVAELESPELRWGFIRKVYSIIATQLLATIAVMAVVVSVKPIPRFFVESYAGVVCHIVLLIFPLLVICPLRAYRHKHPVNYLLLGLFTLSVAFVVGLTGAYTTGKLILQAAILTAAVVISLTVYTFWASRRGHDFTFLGPFLFGSLIGLLTFGIIQIFFPLGKLTLMIYCCVAGVIYCAYIVYDTGNLIKRCNLDDFIWASVGLYLDIVNLFVAFLSILGIGNSC